MSYLYSTTKLVQGRINKGCAHQLQMKAANNNPPNNNPPNNNPPNHYLPEYPPPNNHNNINDDSYWGSEQENIFASSNTTRGGDPCVLTGEEHIYYCRVRAEYYENEDGIGLDHGPYG